MNRGNYEENQRKPHYNRWTDTISNGARLYYKSEVFPLQTTLLGAYKRVKF
jgi:hypothetical protein